MPLCSFLSLSLLNPDPQQVQCQQFTTQSAKRPRRCSSSSKSRSNREERRATATIKSTERLCDDQCWLVPTLILCFSFPFPLPKCVCVTADEDSRRRIVSERRRERASDQSRAETICCCHQRQLLSQHTVSQCRRESVSSRVVDVHPAAVCVAMSPWQERMAAQHQTTTSNNNNPNRTSAP